MFAPKAPSLMKGAYNNTIIRIKTDTQQHTKLQTNKNTYIITKVLIKHLNSGHRKAISIDYESLDFAK